MKLKLLLLMSMVASVALTGCESDSSNNNNNNTDLGVPVLTEPLNGAELSNDMLHFAWSGVEDATRYQLQIASTTTFDTPVVDEELATTSQDFDLTRFDTDITYYWQVRAGDADSWFDWSDHREFSVTTLVILSGTITENMTLNPNHQYLLRGGVFIGDDMNETILSIEPGTVIYGESATLGMLVIRRGSKIMAEGTSGEPIVFTSDKAEGSRSRGDWGGLIINGRAPLNTGDEAFGEGGTGYYGGTDPTDDSGVLNYVRVEFAGQELSPDNELNGIAFQGVGSGTTVDYVQVHMNKDDGVEFFGGTVMTKHLYITGCADDNFDWTDGWQGKGQFWICQQYGDDADQGIEADNNAEENDVTPRSHPMIYNITLIGDMPGEESDIGMLLREGTAANIGNAIVMNFGDCGIDIDHEATFLNAWDEGMGELSGELTVDYSIFFDNNAVAQDDDEAAFPFTSQEFIETLNANNMFNDPMLGDPYNKMNPDYMPQAGSPALSAGMTPPNDGFFDTTVDYIGAMGSVNWLAGWTTAEQN